MLPDPVPISSTPLTLVLALRITQGEANQPQPDSLSP